MTDLLAELKKVVDLKGDTYSSYEVIGLLRRSADEIDRLTKERDEWMAKWLAMGRAAMALADEQSLKE